MIDRDDVVTLPSGTELSVASAISDVRRARDVLMAARRYNGLVCDLDHVAELLDVLSSGNPGPVTGSQKAIAWLETLRSAIIRRDATDYRTPDYERCVHEIVGLCKHQYVDHALAMVRR